MVVVENRHLQQRARTRSLSLVLRGEGWGEGTNASICGPRDIATPCPLTLPSPLSTGERVLSRAHFAHMIRILVLLSISCCVSTSFARALAPTPLPYSFHDNQGMQWDIMPDGTIGPGNADVFDSGARLIVGGSFQYSGATPQCQFDAARNEIVLPSQTLAELSVSRR